ncbi:SEC-C metal-binding domain-containing protein [Streptomyces sp. NPDC052036]
MLCWCGSGRRLRRR